MAKKQVTPELTCSDCIHETACRAWTDGRYISDESASRCPNHETVKGSGAYLCGVLDERKRKQTNADRIRAMSDKELAKFLVGISVDCTSRCDYCAVERKCNSKCIGGVRDWLQQPAEVE